MGNPARANRIQMAQAAAAAVHATDEDGPQLALMTAVVSQPEVQDAGLSDDSNSSPGSSVTSVLRVGVDSGKSDEDGGRKRDLKCLQCGKVFLSERAKCGHQKAHRKRGSKAVETLPATADNALLDGDKQRLWRVSRCEAELPAWPQITTGRRGRPASSASSITAGSVSAPAHQDIMTAEEAAMILLDMKSGRRRPLELEQGIQPAHVADEQPEAVLPVHVMMPRVERPLPPEHHAVATHHVPIVLQPSVPDHSTGADKGQKTWETEKRKQLEHVLAPEAEKVAAQDHVATVTAKSKTPEMKTPTKLSPVTDAVLGYKSGPAADMPKNPMKQRLQDVQQARLTPPPPAEAADADPPARRIPSPASGRTYKCRECHKKFTTGQRLGGHVTAKHRMQEGHAPHRRGWFSRRGAPGQPTGRAEGGRTPEPPVLQDLNEPKDEGENRPPS
ncbi:hypothetical protein GUJ93_ZPchr0014g46780 [Zizania palustris]|uniref:C2H2-type domain-containing protein n=1 Tax=Zizania palustris TaxID=103762 RepID=A0A8J5TKX3_ZIZPA|nr:hypothetical protein GUJ93_ZPchr0014g46780 [Zizania palustris]